MSETDRYRQALIVYIVWHPQFNRGEELAVRIYQHLCNDPKHSTARSIGIPVRFLTSVLDAHKLLLADVPVSADYTAVVMLVDDEMVADSVWGDCVARIWDTYKQAGQAHRVYPVALSEYAFKLHPTLAEVNFIRLPLTMADMQEQSLLNQITHELSRLLLHQPRTSDAGAHRAAGPAPLRVFLSHAKHDGLDLAQGVRAYIAAHTQMETFFDTHDIPPGTEWKKVLYEEAGDTQNALLILQTDLYSTREWCRLEVLQAKLGWVPTLLVNAISTYERRGFPYLGNIPTAKWPPSSEGDPYETVLGMFLYEVLRAAYFPRKVNALAELYSVKRALKAIPYPPELLTLLAMHRILQEYPDTIFVYPDPPLGTEERQLLREAMPHASLITPTLIPSLGRRH